MQKRYLFTKLALLYLMTFFSLLSAKVENSIIPMMQKIEDIENLNPKKYSIEQYKKIAKSLMLEPQKIRIVTYNMLFDIYDDNLEEVYRWPNRLPRIAEMIANMQPDVLCTQELQNHQVEQLLSKIGDVYDFYFKDKEGFCDGIFYRKDRFTLLETKTWFLTAKKQKTPLTMLLLKDQKTQKSFYVFNVHFPFSNPNARALAAKTAAQIIKPYAEKEAVVFTGDLNTFPNRPDIGALPFYDGEYIMEQLKNGKIRPSLNQSMVGHVGPIATYTNIPGKAQKFMGTGTPGVFLDHVLVSSSIVVLAHAIDPAKVDEFFASDHMPVIVDLVNSKEGKP